MAKRVGRKRERARKRNTLQIKHEIHHQLLMLLPSHGRVWVTVYEISNLIGYARSSKIHKLVDQMVDMKKLERRSAHRPGRKPGFEYRLPETKGEPKKEAKPPPRFIKVNGVQIEVAR